MSQSSDPSREERLAFWFSEKAIKDMSPYASMWGYVGEIEMSLSNQEHGIKIAVTLNSDQLKRLHEAQESEVEMFKLTEIAEMENEIAAGVLDQCREWLERSEVAK